MINYYYICKYLKYLTKFLRQIYVNLIVKRQKIKKPSELISLHTKRCENSC